MPRLTRPSCGPVGRFVFDLREGGPVAPGPTVSNRYAGCLRQSAVRLANSAQLQPNRPIFVLKNYLRLGWPIRVPIPRHYPLKLKRSHTQNDCGAFAVFTFFRFPLKLLASSNASFRARSTRRSHSADRTSSDWLFLISDLPSCLLKIKSFADSLLPQTDCPPTVILPEISAQHPSHVPSDSRARNQ